jgi:hypothetical protein
MKAKTEKVKIMRNYYKEDKAMELWCPQIRGTGRMEVTNRKNKSPNFNCIASHCAWWIWLDNIQGRCGGINLFAQEAGEKKSTVRKA